VSNYTPETATLISALPYTMTQPEAEIQAAPTGTGYASTCDANQYHAVWYKYTTKPGERLISVNADLIGIGGFYGPLLSVWTGTPPALTQVKVVGPSETQNYCGNLAGGFWFYIPVTPLTTYYFLVTDSNNTSPLGNGLLFRLRSAPDLGVPIGSLLVNDDVFGFPAATLSAADGSFLQFITGYPAGETSDSVPSGIYCVQNGEADTGVALLNANFQQIATLDWAPASVRGIKTDRSAFFYVVTGQAGAQTVRKISLTGVQVASWALPADSTAARCFAVARDGSIFYYGPRTASAVIHRYDLVNSAPLSDLTAAFGTEQLLGFGDGYVAADGTILFAYATFASGGAAPKIRRFNPNGTVNHTYTIGNGLILMNHFAFADDSPGSFWVWGGVSGPQGPLFQRISLADTLLTSITGVPVAGTSGLADAPFAISNSCPLLITVAAIGPTNPPATLGTVTTKSIRRLRRAPHLWDDALGYKIFYPGFQVIFEAGGPRVDNAAPLQMAMRYSNDAGHTFGASVLISAGELGQYRYRAWWKKCGSGRARVFETVESNAAKMVLLAALLDPEPIKGIS